MDSKKLRPFVVLPILLLLLFVSLVLLANSLVQKPSVQGLLLDRLSELTGYKISLDGIELYVWKGFGIRAHDFQADQKQGFGRIRASQAIIFVDALQLVRGRVVPKRLHVERPIIDLAAPEDSSGEEDKIEERLLSLVLLPGLDSITMYKGSLFINHFPLRFVNLNLEMRKAEAMASNVRCQGEARLGRESTPFHFQGVITQDQKEKKRPSVDLIFAAGKMPLRWIPFPEEVPVRTGLCEAQLRIVAGSNKAARVSGKILVESPRFSIREKGRTKDYSFKFMSFDFRSFLERERIVVPYLNFKTPDASFSVSLRLDFQEKGNPYIRLQGQSLLMTFSTVETLFPAPLVAPWVERDLFPLLSSGDVLLETFLIDGKVLQLKKPELPENVGILSMGFDCRNFTLYGDRLRAPLRNVSATVTLKDGVLRVSELKGASEKSQIQEGLIEVRDIYLPHPAVEPWVRGSFDLEDVVLQCKGDFLPAGFKEAVENLQTVSGTMEGQVRFRYDPFMECPEIIEAHFLFRDAAIKRKEWPFAVVLKEGRLRIGEENHFQGSGSWGASSFEADAGFSLQGLSVDLQWVNIVARIDLGQLWNVISPGWTPAAVKGSALCRGSLKKDADLWSAEGTADIDSMTVDHASFLMNPPGGNDRVTFEVDFAPDKQIRIKQLLWEPRKSRLNFSGDYPLAPEGDITLRASASALSLEDLGLQLKPVSYVLRGALKGELQLKTPKNDLSAAAVSGEMKGENVSFGLPTLPSPVRECEFTALFSGEKIVFPSFSMKTGDSSFKGKGELKGWKGLEGAFTVTSSPLHFSDFVSSGKENREKKEPSSNLDNIDIQLSLDAQPAEWKGIDFERLRADLLFRKREFHIMNSEIHMDRGVLEVRGYVKDEAMAFSGHAEFKDQPMEALLKRLGIEPLYEGNLTMEALLYTEGKEWKDLSSHLDGRTNVLLNKGVIKKSNVFLKILDSLSLQNIFTKRPPDISKEGLFFESIGGHGEIEQGILRTENAQMKSPVLNAVGTGSVDLAKGLIDFDLGVQPLGTIDLVVSNIPVMGYILTGDNKSLITYYFEAKGPILDPQVESVPFKALGTGIMGILKRLFLAPVKVFEDISEGIKKLPAPENVQSSANPNTGY
jgi:hypothetical protein